MVEVFVPGTQVRGSRCDGRSMFMRLLTGMVAVCGKSLPVEVIGGEGDQRTLQTDAYIR